MSRRVWLLVLLGVALVGVAALGYVAGQVRSPEQAVADASPPQPSLVTAAVRGGTLTDQIQLRGSFRDTSAEGVGGFAGLTVTGLPLQADDTVEEGTTVAELNGRPVITVKGSFPLYRDLVGGMKGADVELIQRALKRLGFTVTVDGTFGPGTQSAWSNMLDKRGYEAQPAVPDADAQRRAADDTVAQAKTALKKLRHPAPAAPGKAAPPAAPAAEITAAKQALDAAESSRDETYLSTGPTIEMTEVAVLAHLPRTVTSTGVTVGQVLGEDATVLTFDTGGGGVTVDLPAAAADALGPDTTATAALPDGSTVDLRPREPSANPDTAPADSDQGTVGQVFVPTDPDAVLPGPEIGTVLVTVTLATDDAAGPIVPVSALWTTADGNTAITVVTAEQAADPPGPGTGRDIEVTVESVLGGVARLSDDADVQVGDLVVVAASNVDG